MSGKDTKIDVVSTLLFLQYYREADSVVPNSERKILSQKASIEQKKSNYLLQMVRFQNDVP